MTKAQWAIKAEAACASEGHPDYVDGRCIRCRSYQPESADILESVEAEAKAQVQCPHYTVLQGCPLHGETCAPEYS